MIFYLFRTMAICKLLKEKTMLIYTRKNNLLIQNMFFDKEKIKTIFTDSNEYDGKTLLKFNIFVEKLYKEKKITKNMYKRATLNKN